MRIEATLRGGRTLEKTLVLGRDMSEELRASGDGGSPGTAAGDEALYGAVAEAAQARDRAVFDEAMRSRR